MNIAYCHEMWWCIIRGAGNVRFDKCGWIKQCNMKICQYDCNCEQSHWLFYCWDGNECHCYRFQGSFLRDVAELLMLWWRRCFCYDMTSFRNTRETQYRDPTQYGNATTISTTSNPTNLEGKLCVFNRWWWYSSFWCCLSSISWQDIWQLDPDNEYFVFGVIILSVLFLLMSTLIVGIVLFLKRQKRPHDIHHTTRDWD